MCLIAVSLLPLPAIRRRSMADTATKAGHNAEVRSAVLHALVDGPLDRFPRDRRGGCNEIIWRPAINCVADQLIDEEICHPIADLEFRF